MYEVATSKELWRTSLAQNDFFPMLFTSSDNYLILVTGSREMVVERRAWRAQDLMTRVCPAVARNLTENEWGQFLKEPRPRSCPDFP